MLDKTSMAGTTDIWLRLQISNQSKIVRIESPDLCVGDIIASHIDNKEHIAVITGFGKEDKVGTDLPPNLPIGVAWTDFNVRSVRVTTKAKGKNSDVREDEKKSQSIFTVMMGMARDYKSVPNKR